MTRMHRTYRRDVTIGAVYVLCAIGLSPNGASTEPAYCAPLLQGGLFNATETRLDTELRDELLAKYCQEYSAWRNANRDKGDQLNIKVEQFSLGATNSDTVQKNSGFFHQICSATDAEFYVDQRLRRTTRSASKIIADAYVECVSLANQGFFAWVSATDERTFTLSIRNKLLGDRSLEIQSFQYKPEEANIQCAIDEVMEATKEWPYEVANKQEFDLVCSKDSAVRPL